MMRSAARWLIFDMCIGAEFAVAAPGTVARTAYAVNNFAATVTPFDIAPGTTASATAVIQRVVKVSGRRHPHWRWGY